MKNMMTYSVSSLAAALMLSFSIGAVAETMTKADYSAKKDAISATFKAEKAKCKAFSGNANDVCEAQAKANEDYNKASLEAAYKPTAKNHYDALVAKADGAYTVAKERCDDQSGNANDVCVKEAKAAHERAKADAKVQLKTTEANWKAGKEASEARMDAREKAGDARQDANQAKREADYAVAAQKCDVYSGNTKDACISKAKAYYKM